MESAAPAPVTAAQEPLPSEDLRAVEELAQARAQIVEQIEKRVVGQRDVVEHLLISLFSRGHCLFVGVPGLAKTLLISTLADVLNLSFNRIQFTPDLMPSDITGTDILEEDRATGRREFRFVQGPLFANIILADEVNRTPPKTQAALLQAMQEYRVTAGGHTYPLDLPFLVFATQNPIEQEGTYPLPEAQLDRFMFLVDVGYPTAEEEVQIVKSTTGGAAAEAGARCSRRSRSSRCRSWCAGCRCRTTWCATRWSWCGSTRPKEPGAPEFVAQERVLGRRSAREPVPGARGEGARHPPGPLRGHRRGRAGARAPGAAPPRAAQLPAESEGITSREAGRAAAASW